MRIIKSAHGFSIATATTTIRVTFFDWEGEPTARVYWDGTTGYPDLLQTDDPRGIWRAAFYAARHMARYDLDKQRYHKFWQEEDIISGY